MDATRAGAAELTPCDVCGRLLDTAVMLCPRCGVPRERPAPVDPGVPAAVLAPTLEVSMAAAVLVLASAFVGSVVYVLTYPGETGDSVAWGYALGWGVPLAIVAVGYLGRRLDPRLAAGVFLGAGMAQFFGWLPNVLRSAWTLDGAWFLVGVTSGLLALGGGFLAATARRPVSSGAGASPGAPGDVTSDDAAPAGGLQAPPPPPRFPWTPADGPTKACNRCGHPLHPRALVCPACGSSQPPSETRSG